MDKAAPPRASPSSLVRINPVMPKRVVEVRGDTHRLLTGRRIDHEQDFAGL